MSFLFLLSLFFFAFFSPFCSIWNPTDAAHRPSGVLCFITCGEPNSALFFNKRKKERKGTGNFDRFEMRLNIWSDLIGLDSGSWFVNSTWWTTDWCVLHDLRTVLPLSSIFSILFLWLLLFLFFFFFSFLISSLLLLLLCFAVVTMISIVGIEALANPGHHLSSF